MPRIPDLILDSVIYLYPSRMAAERGEQAGGTGFLLGVAADIFDPKRPNAYPQHIYAVTNSHIVREGHAPVIRFNMKGTNVPDILELREDDWTHHPDGDDLAVVLLRDFGQQAQRKSAYIMYGLMAFPNMVRLLNIGIGDETFFIGRFMAHDGKMQNQPVIRFGNIAMMPSRITHKRGYDVEALLVESRSLAGFSGSPVFVYLDRGIDFLDETRKQIHPYLTGPWLLGVDFGHLPVFEPVVDAGNKEHPDGWRVQANSGMMCVAPAARLDAMLTEQDLRKVRRQIDDERDKDAAVVLDVQGRAFTPNAMDA